MKHQNEITLLGEHIQTKKGYAFKSGWYSDIGTQIVKVSNFTEDSIDTSNLTCIPYSIATDYLKYELKTGDTLVQTVGSWPNNPQSVVGKVIKVPSNASGALLNQNAVKIIPDEFLDANFLFYLLKNHTFKDFIIGCARGAANQASITLDDIRKFSFIMPPLSTQQKIALILSAYDDLIENNTKRIKILEEMAQNIYNEWFVKFRFPGHENVKMLESELGMIPEGWSIKTLEEVCTTITDGSHWSPKAIDVGFPMASVKDMHDWGFDKSKCKIISKEDYDKLVSNNCKPQKNDVLIAKDGSYLKHIFVVEKDMNLVILSSIAILRPKNDICPHFFAMYLKDDSVKARMRGYVSGVAVPRIVLKDFRKFKILLPIQELQDKWCHLIIPMIHECWRLIDKNENLSETRDLLLPRLISGEIDVSELGIDVGGITA